MKNDPGVEVEVVRGGIGEFSVRVDDQEVLRSRLYPKPASIVEKVRATLK